MSDEEINIPLTSFPPEKVLEMIVAELRHPIASIEGWAMLLSKPEMQVQPEEAVDHILKMCQVAKAALEAARSYLADTNPKP